MSNESLALSTIPPRPPAEDDYDLICATMMGSGRGRWFLDEYARRNRNADTALVLAAIERLEQAIKESSGSQRAGEATVQLADSLKALVQHMRQEQQIVRGWVEDHGEQQSEIRKLLEKLSRSPAAERRR